VRVGVIKMVPVMEVEQYCRKAGITLINRENRIEFKEEDFIIVQLEDGTTSCISVESLMELSEQMASEVHNCDEVEQLGLVLSQDKDGWCVSIKDTLGRGVYPIRHCPGCGVSLIN
jgi:hypothetical protein